MLISVIVKALKSYVSEEETFHDMHSEVQMENVIILSDSD